jgi:hypothetical protein
LLDNTTKQAKYETARRGNYIASYWGPHENGLIDLAELQALLKPDQDLQFLICGSSRMNKSGRDYFLEDSGDKSKTVRVLESVSDNVDFD